MVDFLFVNVPFYRLLGSCYNSNSLGIAYLASVLKHAGHNAWIYNADYQDKSFNNLKGIFDNAEQYKEYFKNDNHPIWTETVENILNFNPDFVGYSCYTANIPSIQIISKHIKKKNNKIKQVIGGPHITLDPNASFLFPHIDHFIKGEGEKKILHVVGDTFYTYPIDDIHLTPFPERKNFWVSKNLNNSYIITSRGCPYACTFCGSPGIWKRKVRFRNIESIMYEMYEMNKSYNINHFYFLDDTLTANKKRAIELFNRVRYLNITWKCNTRLDCLNDELCEAMAKSGCIEAKVGVESGSERILKLINKNETKEQMLNGINLLKKYNIPITAYLMTGFPFETDDDLRETIDFANEIDVDKYSLSVFAPYFGTEIYNDLLKNNISLMTNYEYFYHQSPKPLVNDRLSKNLFKRYLSLGERKQ